jgi:hypothetical protein
MITASVSWTVLLYPALARSRQFARRVSVLIEAEQRSGLSIVRELGVPLLLELAQAVLQFRIDITLFPVLFNFYAAERIHRRSRLAQDPAFCARSCRVR